MSEPIGTSRLYRDSTGVLREAAPDAGTDASATMLPSSDFTDEQKAMARLPLPFRNIIRDPFVPAIGQTAKTTAYPAEMVAAIAEKCSSFRIINPNNCCIRFRGAADLNDKILEGEGRLIGPYGTEVFSTQNPTYLSVMPVARPGSPIPSELAPPELNYGIGG